MSLVRQAEIRDVGAIAAVHVASWRTTYRGLIPDDYLAALSEADYLERWRRTISDGRTCVYVAEDNHRVVGFASGGRERAGEDGFGGELYSIYVVDSAQGRGHGRGLVRAVVGGLRERGLTDMLVWVLGGNAGARRFYERLGGVYVREQQITVASAALQEVSYGWRRLEDVQY